NLVATNNAPSVYPVGTTTVTWTATDAAGNTATCSQTVTVTDNQPPTAVCPSNITQPAASGLCSAVVNFTLPAPTDNCSATSAASPASGSTFNVGTSTVTVTATDGANNTGTCSFTVTVTDNQPPTLTCPAPQTLPAITNTCAANYTISDPISDNCTATWGYSLGGATIAASSGIADGTDSGVLSFNVGVTTVTLSGTDGTNAATTCSFTVTVTDTQPPVITCAGPVNINTTPGLCTGTTVLTNPTISDNCAGSLGNALHFASGSANEVTAPITGLPTGNAVRTVEFWVKIPNSNQHHIVSWGNFTCAIYPVGGVMRPHLWGSFNDVSSTTLSVPYNTWTHIAYVLTGTQIIFYVNGVADAKPYTHNTGSTGSLYVGSYFGATGQTVDEVRIWNTARTQAQIQGSMGTELSGSEAGLVAYYKFNQGTAGGNNAGITTLNATTGQNGTLVSFGLNGPSSNWVAGLTFPLFTNNAPSVYPVGTTTVTWTATDAAGNTATCSQTVTVTDNQPPTALCQPVTVQLNASGTGSTTAAAVNNGSSDACGIQSLTLSQTAFTCANVGSNTVTLTVRDVNNNTSTCSATVTVQDLVAPVAVCQNVTVELNASGTGSTMGAAVNNGSSDACGIQSLSLSQTTFNCANVGSNTVTLTVTDVNNNTATCSATVTVQDLVVPVAVCQNVTVQLDNTGNGSTTAAAVNNGSSDACGIQTLSLSQTAFTCANVGSNTVTLTVTDVNSNVNTCTATVTVQDTVLPVALCQPVTVQLDNTGNGSTTASAVNNGSSDACGIQTLSLSQTAFTCANVGSNTVTLTVTDVNSNVNTCTATVTVQDTVLPVALCQPVTVQLDNTGNGSTTASAVNNGSSDACGIQSLSLSQTAFTCASIATNPNTVTLTVTDVNNNTSTCTATVTVEDNIAPTAICQNPTVALNSAGTVTITPAQINNGSSDNCAVQGYSLSQSTFDCTEVGFNTVIMTVTDVNGQTSTCSSLVRVIETLPPTAVCQNITVQLQTGGSVNVAASAVNNGSSDNCGTITLALSQTTFTCSNIGVNTVVLTVTDANSNTATCSATITVQDNIAPLAVCQPVTVQLNSGGAASVTGTQVNNGSSDACGIQSLSVTPNSFTCGNVGGNTVTLTVTDVNNNTTTCSATVTVQDNIAPLAVCQPVTVQLNSGGTASVTGTQVNNGSSDACGIQSLSVTPNSFTCGNVGGNTVTLTATDVNGNTATCSATVTVQDNIAPLAVCQPVTVQLNSGGTATVTGTQVNNGSSDNCAIQSLGVVPNSFTCANVGNNTVTLTVTDVNGNTSTCSATVTVQDNIAPNAVCQNSSVQLNTSGTAGLTAGQVNNGSSDNCGIQSISVLPNSFTCANVGSNTVTLTVTDVNGQSATCSALVLVQDVTPPTAFCQSGIIVSLNSGGTGSITTSMVNNGSSDNCGIASVTASPLNFTCADVGNPIVVLTVTDLSNNTATCGSTITVKDNILPTAICQNIAVQIGVGGTVTVVPAQVNNGSNDNCGIATMSLSKSIFTCADVGSQTVVLTVTDASGNSASCSAGVTVNETTAPTAVCQTTPVIAQISPAGTATITAAQINNGSTDNCSGSVNLSVTPNSFTCSNIGNNTVTLTVSDTNGNSSSCAATVLVQDPVAPTAACKSSFVYLNALGTASITASQVNNNSSDNCGVSGISVLPNTFNCANIGNNTVTLTVTDFSSNTATCNATVTVYDDILPVANCQNIAVAISGGTASITAAQVNSSSTDNCGIANMSVIPSLFSCANVGNNTVTLTVSDSSGNTATCSATVTVTSTIPATIGSNSPVCVGNTINLTATGGGFYQWVGPGGFSSTQQNPVRTGATIAMGGIYSVTVTSASGCTTALSTTVTVNSLPVASITGATSVCAGNTINLTANGGVSYQWSGPNGFTSIQQNIVRTDATAPMGGMYTVTVTNSGGCTATTNINVTVNPVPTATVGNNGPVCIGSTINLSASGGVTYSWIGPNGYSSSAQNPVRTGATLAMAGNYLVTVTNSSGCTASSYTTVSVVTAPAASVTGTSSVCAGGVISLTASGGVSYSWNGPSGYTASGVNIMLSPATAAMAGTYTVTVTGSGGCTATASRTVTVNAAPVVSISGTTVICAGNTITLSATGGTTYIWSGPNGFSSGGSSVAVVSATVAASGTYTVTVTNASGCTATASQAVTVNAVPVATAGSNSPVCSGNAINLTASGGSSYSWIGPSLFSSTVQNPVRLNATTSMSGTYSVTVTNISGCSAWAVTSVTVNASPTANISGVSSVCAGGTISLTASGGTLYAWSGPNGFTGNTAGISIPSATTAMTGTYTVTVTGSSGCTATASRAVTVNAVPVATASNNGPLCAGAALTLSSSGGSSYSWSGPNGFVSMAQNPVLSSVTTAMAGTYTVTVTNASGCSSVANTVVSISTCGTPIVVTSYSITKNSSLTTIGNGSITLYVTGGVPCPPPGAAYSYAWSPATGTMTSSGTTHTYSGLLAGWYVVTITDCGGNSLVTYYYVPNTSRGFGFKTGEKGVENLTASPNPTGGQTTVSFNSHANERMRLAVYAVDGKEVGVLFDGIAQEESFYEFVFDMNDLPSGTYYAVLRTESGVQEQIRVLVIR
ncbi:hypothetical protein C7N43_15525, partial [Sphingobacteriales bacterium UPWRP_1]